MGTLQIKTEINNQHKSSQVKCWFFEERGNRSTRRKPLGAEQRTNKLNTCMTPDLEIEPRPHWWEASALTTVPSLHIILSLVSCNRNQDGLQLCGPSGNRVTIWTLSHFLFLFFFFFQEESKQERANVDIVWQLENKNKEIQTLNARVQKVLLFSLCH